MLGTGSLTLLWDKFRNDWFDTQRAVTLFVVSTLLVLALTPVFLGQVDPNRLTFWARLPWGILGILGPIALFFLWLGMWRYWVRVDDGAVWTKRIWFVVLLVGFWWGSCLYCFAVYVPQVLRRRRATV